MSNKKKYERDKARMVYMQIDRKKYLEIRKKYVIGGRYETQ